MFCFGVTEALFDIFKFFFCSFMLEFLSKLNITFSTKDQVLDVLDKCNALLLGGETTIVDVYLFSFLLPNSVHVLNVYQ